MFNSAKHIKFDGLSQWDSQFNLDLKYNSVSKGELFLKAGQRCNHLYFIMSGFIRVYYYDLNGNEITHWFCAKDSIITSPFSFLKKEPNILFFEALEETEMVLMNANQLDKLIAHQPELGTALRHINAEFAMVLSRRIMSIHNQTAEQRYLELMKDHPLLFQLAKLSHIASFLGITQQSLSRIRKNLLT